MRRKPSPQNRPIPLANKNPAIAGGVSHSEAVCRPYGAEDIAGTSTDIAGSSLDSSEAIEERADETAELIADSADDTADETAEDTASEETTAEEDGAGASLDTTAELDGSTGVTGVGVPRLKIQIRPTITTTATMMIIQVLRFI